MHAYDVILVNIDDTADREVPIDEVAGIALTVATEARPRITSERMESIDNSVRCCCGHECCSK